MDRKLLDILVCPVCKGPLIYDRDKSELVCRAERLAYPVHNDIPVLIEEESRQLSEEEVSSLS